MIPRLFLLLFLGIGLAAQELLTRTQLHMGTLVSITLPKDNAVWIQKGFETIRGIECVLSSYRHNADVYRLNHGETVAISPETYEALLLSQRYYAQSGGYFDITVGSITKGLYHFGEEEQLVDNARLERALIDHNALRFNRYFASLEQGITIDLGGMGKGYAVDKVAGLYRQHGIRVGVIAASGDIRCLSECAVEIENPFGEGMAASFKTRLPDMAISTSGNYRRYIGSRSSNHLINPKRKRSQQLFASITLIAKMRNSDLDAFATAASVMTEREAVAFLEGLSVEYLLIMADGRKILSPHLDELVSEFHVKK